MRDSFVSPAHQAFLMRRVIAEFEKGTSPSEAVALLSRMVASQTQADLALTDADIVSEAGLRKRA